MNKTTAPQNAATRQLLWSALLAEECSRRGVRHVFVCPGSRSAPLATAFAAHPELRCHVHFDERGAAFAALGVARATTRPAAVITTSGTAVANLLPAVLEAHEDAVPLLLLTADRPPELRGCGANQTCDQTTILAPHCRFFFDLPAHNSGFSPAALLGTLGEALAKSLHPLPGPAHLNIQMREPLLAAAMDPQYPVTIGALKKFFSPQELAPLQDWLRGSAPFIRAASAPDDAVALLARIKQHRPQLLLCGSLRSHAEQRAALHLVRELGIPCFADLCSGLRGQAADIRLAAEAMQFSPPVSSRRADRSPASGNLPVPLRVLRLGGRLINPLVEKWCAAQHTLQITDGRRINPLHAPRDILTARLGALAEGIESCTATSPTTSWPSEPTEGKTAHAKKAAAITATPVTDHTTPADPLVAAVQQHAPQGCALFLGNSLPVRIFDEHWTGRPDITAIAANRGVSGIDGNIATAVGCALGWERPTVAVVGDQTALHDLNSLALLRLLDEQSAPFTLIIVNNGGGRIFERLGHTARTSRPEVFLGVPADNFSAAARMWGLPYRQVGSTAELGRLLGKNRRHQVVEVFF
jgi:2-succinyl-5-enolpyruvyl-6-hydroxy-3-cyclohexene-1-carboxylate synthase